MVAQCPSAGVAAHRMNAEAAMRTQQTSTIGKINVELTVLPIAEPVHLPELQQPP